MWGNFSAAKGEMLRASELAESAGYDLARARALVDLVYVVGYELQDFEQGELFVRMARGPLQKAGGDRSLEATLLRNAGMVSHAARDYQRARERQLASLGIREKLYGAQSAQAAEVLTDLAGTLRELGQRDEALTRVRKAVEIFQRLFGKANRFYARAITELGHVLASRGDFDDARKVYQEGVDVAYATLDADHPLVAIALVNRGNIELLAGEPVEAISYYEKALAIESKALGPDHLQVAASLMNLGAARESAGQLVEAERSYGRALAIRTRHLGEHHALVGESVGAIGLVELRRNKLARAIEDLERAVALAEENRDVSERIGELHFGLARALWQGRGDRDRARELARKAVQELTTAKADDEAADARAWLEQR
jgi:tetratricopeptide (TPR) repeat protein